MSTETITEINAESSLPSSSSSTLIGFKPSRQQRMKNLIFRVIAAARTVYDDLKYGFSEDCYQHALERELSLVMPDVQVIPQYSIRIKYKDHYIGTGRADFLIIEPKAGTLIVELKTGLTRTVLRNGYTQSLMYKRAMERNRGLLGDTFDILVLGFLPTAVVYLKEDQLCSFDAELEEK